MTTTESGYSSQDLCPSSKHALSCLSFTIILKLMKQLKPKKRQEARRTGFYRHASSYDWCNQGEQPSERDTRRPLLGCSPRRLCSRTGSTTALEAHRENNYARASPIKGYECVTQVHQRLRFIADFSGACSLMPVSYASFINVNEEDENTNK